MRILAPRPPLTTSSGISGGQIALVEQQRGLLSGGNGDSFARCRKNCRWTKAACPQHNSARLPHRLQALRPLLFHGDIARHQHPSRMHVLRLAPGGRADHLRRLPRGIVEVPLLPAPRICRRVHPLRRPHHKIAAHGTVSHLRGRIGRVAHALPIRPAIGRALGRAVAFEEEAGFEGDLRLRRHFAEIPHHRRQHVAPGFQVRGQVHGFVAPVEQVAARRPGGYAPAVGEKLVAIVGARRAPRSVRAWPPGRKRGGSGRRRIRWRTCRARESSARSTRAAASRGPAPVPPAARRPCPSETYGGKD